MPAKHKLSHAIWALVPAAGIGKRMQSATPKQYLSLNGRPVIEHTVNKLLESKYISGLVVALQSDDNYWQEINIASDKPVLFAPGGDERADSVLNALTTLMQHKSYTNTDWVMVHDAVRPCLRLHDVEKLVLEIEADDGGLLALPVRDTMKRQQVITAAKGRSACDVVAETVERKNLWHALTPQYFPAKKLKDALERALKNKQTVTDESSAMEMAGFSPKLIHGSEDNIKITHPDDLRLASLFLQSHSN